MAAPLFDLDLRALRRDRAARIGAELFLHERAFDDCLERIALVQRRFRSALLIGCPAPGWRERLGGQVDQLDAFEPGPLMAQSAGAQLVVEDLWTPPGRYDLCIAVGTLDSVNDLPGVLRRIREAMTPDALFIGALGGGDTLPALRSAMRAADEQMGFASAHAHPRIEAAALAPLLSSCGFVMPVVDLDRVQLSYAKLGALVRDLRAMGATNTLNARPRTGLSRAALAAAERKFHSEGNANRTREVVEILHFAAWTPATPQG